MCAQTPEMRYDAPPTHLKYVYMTTISERFDPRDFWPYMAKEDRMDYNHYVCRAVRRIGQMLEEGETEFNIAKSHVDHRVLTWRVNQEIMHHYGKFIVYEPWNVNTMSLIMKVKVL